MLGDQLVVGNIDKQVVLEETLDLGEGLDAGERLAGGGRQGNVGDHDARLVVVRDDVRRELADLAHAERLVGEELDPDGAAVRDWVGLVGRGWGGELSQHGLAGTGGELKLCAARCFAKRCQLCCLVYVYIAIARMRSLCFLT